MGEWGGDVNFMGSKGLGERVEPLLVKGGRGGHIVSVLPTILVLHFPVGNSGTSI